MAEKALMQKFEVTPQRIRHGVAIRIPRISAKDLLWDWNAWRQLLSRTDLDNWLLDELDAEVSKVTVLVDNGLGGDGVCPAHGYQHLQILPMNKQPMLCAEAVVLTKGKD